MLTIIALASGLACTSVCWFVLEHQKEKALLKSRTAESVAVHFPYPLGTNQSGDRDIPVTYEEAQKDGIAKSLFLAGLRDKRIIQFFHLLNKLSWLLPAGLLVFVFMTGLPNFMYLIRISALGITIFLLVRFILRVLVEKRQQKIIKTLPQLLDLMIVCIEAGLNFTAALPRVMSELDPKDPLVKEFTIMHHEYLSGIPLHEALDRLGKRCQTPDLAIVLNAISQSEQMGTSLGNTLRIQAAQLRDKKRQRMREQAQKIPVKIVFPAMIILSTIFIVTLAPAIYSVLTNMEKSGVIDSVQSLKKHEARK